MRTTVGNRDLSYIIKIIQQPQLARTGQSGEETKDRKPVDPPPILSLRIFEHKEGIQEDITLSYDGFFITYASLEDLQQVGDGKTSLTRGHPAPVLRSPVSGTHYFDHPYKGIFFIFPELSISHEGRYKLRFDLYETIEEPQNFDENAKKRSFFAGSNHSSVSNSTGDGFQWRMEIKSEEFDVYSAKRFPGFSESTTLTRTFAEQGCRVMLRKAASTMLQMAAPVDDISKLGPTRILPPNISQQICISDETVSARLFGDAYVHERELSHYQPATNVSSASSGFRPMSEDLAPHSLPQKKYICIYCDEQFARHHNLKSHLLTHSQEKRHICQTCTMRFRAFHDLERHMKLHDGERLHVCVRCNRKFARAHALVRHNEGDCGGTPEVDDDVENINSRNSDTSALGISTYPDSTTRLTETEVAEKERGPLRSSIVEVQKVTATRVRSNSPNSQQISNESLHENLTPSTVGFKRQARENLESLLISEESLTSKGIPSLQFLTETSKADASDDTISKKALSKDEIALILLGCWGTGTALSQKYHSASEATVMPVNNEPRSYAIKRQCHDWWLVHSSEPWDNILSEQYVSAPFGTKYLRFMLSSWYQDLQDPTDHSRRRYMIIGSATILGHEERVVEQLAHDICLHLGTSRVFEKTTPAGNRNSSTRTTSSSAQDYRTSEASKIAERRKGRSDEAVDDDDLDSNDPSQNDRTERPKKTTDHYNRYVICPQFAAGQEPARQNCFFGAWCSVDRLKQDHLIYAHNFSTSQLKIDRGGTEAEKWWKLFDKLNPDFRKTNPEVFVPGPSWGDRVAHNTYNKVFSEAMKRAERIREMRTQNLASDIQNLLHRQRDAERQEIGQAVLDILHSGTRTASLSDWPDTTAARSEPGSFHHAGGPTSTSESRQGNLESMSPSALNNMHLPLASETNTPGPSHFFGGPSLHGILSDSHEPPTSSQWELSQDELCMGTQLTDENVIPQLPGTLGAQFEVELATTTTSSSETMSGTLSNANGLDIEQPFGKLCRCRFHSAECDLGVGAGNEWCACCSGWFPWSAFAEPLIMR